MSFKFLLFSWLIFSLCDMTAKSELYPNIFLKLPHSFYKEWEGGKNPFTRKRVDKYFKWEWIKDMIFPLEWQLDLKLIKLLLFEIHFWACAERIMLTWNVLYLSRTNVWIAIMMLNSTFPYLLRSVGSPFSFVSFRVASLNLCLHVIWQTETIKCNFFLANFSWEFL